MLWGHPLKAKELTETVRGLTTMIDEKFARLRTYRNNINRYRQLLKTDLSDLEREFIERRLEEDRSAMQRARGVGIGSARPPQSNDSC